MMDRYKFLQQVKIHDKVFHLGVNQVEQQYLEHPHFLHYAKCGWIIEAPPEEVSSQQPASVLAQNVVKRVEEMLSKKKEPEQVHEGVQEKAPRKGAKKAKEDKPAEQVREGVQEAEPAAKED